MTYLIKNPSYRSVLSDPSRVFESFLDWDPFNGLSQATYSQNAANIQETDKNYQITLELPGVQKKDIQIEYKESILSIKANKKRLEEQTESDNQFISREISQGDIERQFRVQDIQFDDAKAEYQNGILHITLPKTPEAQAQTLTIK